MFKVIAGACLVVSATFGMAQAETRSLDSHVHGEGKLNLVLLGKRVDLEFHTPAMSLVGFEHRAESAEQKQAVANAIAALSKPTELFGIVEEASCSLSSVNAELERDGHGDEHEGEKHEEASHKHDYDHEAEKATDETDHSEFHLKASLECSQPDSLKVWETKIFERFPGLEAIDVQVISASGQRGFELTKDNPQLNLIGLTN